MQTAFKHFHKRKRHIRKDMPLMGAGTAIFGSGLCFSPLAPLFAGSLANQLYQSIPAEFRASRCVLR